MQVLNEQTITIDLRRTVTIPVPRYRQYDTNILNIIVKDNKEDADLSNVSLITANYLRPDGEVVSRTLQKLGDVIEYQIKLEESQVFGEGELSIHLFEVDKRLSTKRIKIIMDESLEPSIEGTEDLTLLQELFQQVSTTLSDIQTASQEITEAEALRVTAEETRAEAELLRQTAETNRQTVESERVSAELERTTSEQLRATAETERVESETTRQTAETARIEAEEERQSNTTIAIQNAEYAVAGAIEATNEINLVLPKILNLEYIAPFNATTQYLKNNIVRHGKNSYIALQDTLGNEPTGNNDSPYWGVIAIGGIDGLGSVVTVNGVSPDERGNVTITIPDSDLSGLATKDDLISLEDEFTNHLDAKMPHAQNGITYYVRPDGNDNNLGTSNNSTGAFRSIQTAINKLKKYISGTSKIRILPGDYSSEGPIKMEGFYGSGRIILTAYDGLVDVQNTENSDLYAIDSLFINNCRNGIDVFSLKSTYNGSERSGFYAINSSFVFFGWCRDTIESSVKVGFLFEVGSTGTCSGCICSNKGVALEVRNSRVNSSAWMPGNANSVGIKVIQAGVVGKYNIQPQSTIMEIMDSGGAIR